MGTHHGDHVQDDKAHDDHVELFVGDDAKHYRAGNGNWVIMPQKNS